MNYYLSQKNLVSNQDCDQVSEQDKPQDILHAVLDFCITEKSKQEICSLILQENIWILYWQAASLKWLFQISQTVENKNILPSIPSKIRSRALGLISHCPASFHSKLYSHHLPIRPILDRKFQTLHLAQQPDRSQRQSHRANQKCHNLLYLTTKNWVKTALVWSNQVKLYQPV